ncbi:MAG TPA: alpha-L-fucosidase [Anaerolineae bacterium]|nr:alpha-L-fucosidase [Anaerolineae bacterium]HQK13101.1 alpha-L-fucosidase [Anaerolineae bacterium]
MHTYQPTLASVKQHPLPTWFEDAKLGIFVHWGPYSVPGWAPRTGNLREVIIRHDDAHWFAHNPYAEWYCQAMQITGSPTQRYHAETYGTHTPYAAFGPQFNAAARGWDPWAWGDLFRRAGARYVVMVTKHHDGFLMWPSAVPNPHRPDWHAARDFVGELTEAVRINGLRMGLYYSGGLDFTFKDVVIRDFADMLTAIPTDPGYATYADAHWRELIKRYAPSVLWNDIGYPASANLPALFADYYNAVSDGVVNDRFMQINLPGFRNLTGLPRKLIRWLIRRAITHPQSLAARLQTGGLHCDFRTPEYAIYNNVTTQKWETARGLGASFGYNRNEHADDFISVKELIHLLADVVSKNGNLLLNVGPMADGTIPAAQVARLEGLGAWLKVNGEAIYGTRPWQQAKGRTGEGLAVRFTQKADVLYAIVLGRPQAPQLEIPAVPLTNTTRVYVLGYNAPFAWTPHSTGLRLTLPRTLPDTPAVALKIVPR